MQTLKNQKFYKRLITTFIIVSVLPCILIGLFSSILVDRLIQDRLIREASLTTENAISSISGLIAKYTDALENFSTNDSVLSLLCSSNKDESQIKTIYAEMYSIQTSLHPSGDVHIIRTSDNYTISLHGTPNLYDYPKNQNWGNFRLANESYSVIVYTTLYTNFQNTEMAISVMKAIRYQNEIIGYTALDIPLDAIREQLTGTYDLLPIHFTLMTNHYYALFNDIGLDSKNSFKSICSFRVLPYTIAPNFPFPRGSACSHESAGFLNQIVLFFIIQHPPNLYFLYHGMISSQHTIQ